MITEIKNMYLTAMKITANINNKVIHYLSKKRCGRVEWIQETTGSEKLGISREFKL